MLIREIFEEPRENFEERACIIHQLGNPMETGQEAINKKQKHLPHMQNRRNVNEKPIRIYSTCIGKGRTNY